MLYKIILVLGIFLVGWVPEAISQRWYYTGKFQHDTERTNFFNGDILLHNSLFESTNFKGENSSSQMLYCGGLVLTPIAPYLDVERKETFQAQEWDFILNVTFTNTRSSDEEVEIHNITITSVARYIINIAKTYPEPQVEQVVVSNEDNSTKVIEKISWPILNAEVGLYDGRRGIFVQREWRSLNIGTVVACRATDSMGTVHKLIWTTDMYGRMSLVHHTWNPQIIAQQVEYDVSDDGTPASMGVDLDSKSFRVMTYNLWHNNPPGWVYGEKRQRWKRYERRIRHFAEMVVRSRADVIALQEVRLDSSFYSIENTINYWRNHSANKVDGGSQIEHLLHHIAAARRRLNSTDNWDYQVVYQPAMSMWDRGSLANRNEEGVMILSRFPVIESKVFFLPRDVGNPADDHQRILLVVQVSIDGKNATVGTSHWSLHEPSRDMTVERIFQFLKDDIFSTSSLQILTGDLNAEPHENAIRKLTSTLGDGETMEHDRFNDVWTLLHEEEAGFTFPTCKPVKRIDFIVARNNSGCSNQCYVSKVVDAFILGDDPTVDTIHLIGSREGLGMNDEDSPIWASDHLAVVADILLLK